MHETVVRYYDAHHQLYLSEPQIRYSVGTIALIQHASNSVLNSSSNVSYLNLCESPNEKSNESQWYSIPSMDQDYNSGEISLFT